MSAAEVLGNKSEPFKDYETPRHCIGLKGTQGTGRFGVRHFAVATSVAGGSGEEDVLVSVCTRDENMETVRGFLMKASLPSWPASLRCFSSGAMLLASYVTSSRRQARGPVALYPLPISFEGV